jgi:hypothetical protein
LSRGLLSTALNATTGLARVGQVSFAWDYNSLEGNANATDKAMVLVYNPSKKESMYVLDGAIRTTGSQTVNIPGTYAGDALELFIAFVSACKSLFILLNYIV